MCMCKINARIQEGRRRWYRGDIIPIRSCRREKDKGSVKFEGAPRAADSLLIDSKRGMIVREYRRDCEKRVRRAPQRSLLFISVHFTCGSLKSRSTLYVAGRSIDNTGLSKVQSKFLHAVDRISPNFRNSMKL